MCQGMVVQYVWDIFHQAKSVCWNLVLTLSETTSIRSVKGFAALCPSLENSFGSSINSTFYLSKTSINLWWKNLSFDWLDIILCLYVLPHCRYSQLLIALKPQERWKQLKRARRVFLFRNGPDSPVKWGRECPTYHVTILKSGPSLFNLPCF